MDKYKNLLIRAHKSLLRSQLESVIETEKGEIFFARGKLETYLVDDVLQILQDLHYRAVGDTPLLEINHDLSREEAKSLYRRINGSVLAQVPLMTEHAASSMAKRIADYCYLSNDSSGLESFFASLTVQTEVGNQAIAKSYERWSKVGWPTSPSAGHDFSASLSKHGLQKITEQDLSEFLLSDRSTDFHSRIAARQSMFSMDDESRCVAVFGALGVFGGAAAGAVVGPGGAGLGAALGGAGGTLVGVVLCDPETYSESTGNDAPTVERGTTEENDARTEEDDDNPPPPPDDEEEESEEGCVPYDADLFVRNAYVGLVRSSSDVAIPFGDGRRAFVAFEKGIFNATALAPSRYASGFRFGYLESIPAFSRYRESVKRISRAYRLEKGLPPESFDQVSDAGRTEGIESDLPNLTDQPWRNVDRPKAYKPSDLIELTLPDGVEDVRKYLAEKHFGATINEHTRYIKVETPEGEKIEEIKTFVVWLDPDSPAYVVLNNLNGVEIDPEDARHFAWVLSMINKIPLDPGRDIGIESEVSRLQQ